MIDTSKMVLTHHHLKNRGKVDMVLKGGEYPKLQPTTAVGTGQIREKNKVYLAELIESLNNLFGAETTDQDKLSFVQSVQGKMLESEKLREQALNNTEEQFRNSPDLGTELVNAIIGNMDANASMSTAALNSSHVQKGLMHLLFGLGLYNNLRSPDGPSAGA